MNESGVVSAAQNIPTFAIWIVVLLYFVPSTIAVGRGHHNSGSIFVINLLLGFTYVGWVVALAMAVSSLGSVEA